MVWTSLTKVRSIHNTFARNVRPWVTIAAEFSKTDTLQTIWKCVLPISVASQINMVTSGKLIKHEYIFIFIFIKFGGWGKGSQLQEGNKCDNK